MGAGGRGGVRRVHHRPGPDGGGDRAAGSDGGPESAHHPPGIGHLGGDGLPAGLHGGDAAAGTAGRRAWVRPRLLGIAGGVRHRNDAGGAVRRIGVAERSAGTAGSNRSSAGHPGHRRWRRGAHQPGHRRRPDDATAAGPGAGDRGRRGRGGQHVGAGLRRRDHRALGLAGNFLAERAAGGSNRGGAALGAETGCIRNADGLPGRGDYPDR